ncbi:Rab3 GTPase-activating protein regulatory subunit [Phytophthora infestans]|uniref:Rab3 GTPase-activating protein regulatory subunit n=1 Tax=Phytophthora infestans TaxID=4787 RepID=A0A833SS08_PHYIN|nr:Rab3 GTPase-activating protein regulatory subunit [Phytophthora infestans]
MASSAARVGSELPPFDSEDAFAVALRIDSSSLRSGEAPDIFVSLYDDPRVHVDVAEDLTLLLGFERKIYSVGVQEDMENNSQTTASLCVIVDADSIHLEEDEQVADVKWLDRERFCAGYTSGIVRIFNRVGKLLFEQKLHGATVLKLDVNRNAATITAPRRASVLLSSEPDMEGELWVLYTDSTVAIIQISEILAKLNSVFGPAQASKFRKYSLREQKDIVAAIPCGPVRPTIFQSHSRLGVYTIISAGSAPFLAFYQAGNDQNSIIHLAHIATAIASRAAGAVWNFATSWGWRRDAGEGATGEAGHTEYTQLGSGAIDAAAEHVPAPIGTTRSIYEDERRRCRVLVLSPTGRLAAVSDTLGRILLVDTARMLVIRMWKGYRNAQVGWMQGSDGARRPPGLYLVIYSAQRGIVEVWRARYGPRVFSFAVGNCAKLFTQFDPVTRRTKCVVLCATSDHVSELIELKPGLPNASILMKYFTQNKLQEENFLLHQVIGGLQAFVKKKRVDATHTLEQDSLEPLLEDIGSLSSSTTIQTLLDVLLNADMALLNASFLLKALEKLQLALKSGMSSRTPTGVELSLQWKLLWQHRLVTSFIGFQAEFERGKHALVSMIQTSTRDIISRASTKKHESGPLPRVLPWLELLRRAGLALDDESCSRTRTAMDSASQLTAWEFMEFFSMPFNDPDLPRRRDILSLFEVAETKEEFLRDTFRVLKTSIFRKFSTTAQRDCLLTFILAPVLSSVFAVQELQQLHSAIFLTEDMLTRLFIEWYFSLPLGGILALPPPSMSSSLQRWLQPYFVISDVETGIQEEGEDNAKTSFVSTESYLRRLRGCPPSLVEIFNSCWKTPKLFHGFVLSEHCGWGDKKSAKHAEEDTFGKYSSVGSGARWVILQDCIAKTVHLSLRLGKVGRLSVDAVEHVDDIMRSIAVMQINDGHEPGEDDAAVQLPKDHVEVSVGDDGTDGWVATMENCRKAAQMKDWAAVLGAYPQFANKDALCCFRVGILCAAWNAERSDMRQLEDALLELDCVVSLQVKAAMAAYIWERYIRVHVVTLITFWEESAAGRKPQRGLQPQVARRFFCIIRNLLVMLFNAVKAVAAVRVVATEYEAESDYDDETSDADVESDDDDESMSRIAVFKMESLTQSIKWRCRVKDLHLVYRQRWPPAHDMSTLMQALQGFKLDMVSVAQIADHISLVMLLDSFAATSVTPISIVKLFSNSGRCLCRPDSFLTTQQLAQPSEVETTSVTRDRTRFLKELLRHDETLGFALAEAFGLPLEVIREEYVVFLYQSGRDERADLAIEKMQRPEQLVLKLGAIARARLSLILRRMKTEAEFAAVMSMLPADTFSWVISDTKPPLVADPLVEKLDLTPSLTSTHYLLLKCLAMISPTGEEFEKVSVMSVLVKDVISQVKLHHRATGCN